jgi:hypothetical protein
MSEVRSSSALRREELYEDLFRSIEVEFGDEGKSLKEQAEAFFRETNLSELIICWKGGRAEEILKDLPPGLQAFILKMLEDADKRAKQALQESEK